MCLHFRVSLLLSHITVLFVNLAPNCHMFIQAAAAAAVVVVNYNDSCIRDARQRIVLVSYGAASQPKYSDIHQRHYSV